MKLICKIIKWIMGHRILYIPKPVNQIYSPKYGLLYNLYAATDSRKITSSDDWIIPTLSNYSTLSTYLGGNTVSGGKLKESGLTYWNSPNTGATNSSGFNGRAAGYRHESTGVFDLITAREFLTISNPTTNIKGLAYNSASFINVSFSNYNKVGTSIRLLWVGAGTPTSYTGNDGKIYRVVTIGTQTWLADNLSETRFRNNDIIPWYGANPANYFTNAEWAALTTAGCCAHSNTLSNVATGFTFPT